MKPTEHERTAIPRPSTSDEDEVESTTEWRLRTAQEADPTQDQLRALDAAASALARQLDVFAARHSQTTWPGPSSLHIAVEQAAAAAHDAHACILDARRAVENERS